MTPVELTLKNAKVVTVAETFEGAVHVRGGVIAATDSGRHNGPAVDLEGDYLIPGLIDLHTDNFDRHVRPRNNADWPVIAALLAHDAQMVAAGITTICDSLYVGGGRSLDILKKIIAEMHVCQDEGLLRGDHYLHLRAEVSTEAMPAMFASVYPDPRVRLVSLMDHTPGQRQWRDLEKYVAMEKKDFHLTQDEIDEFLRTAQERHEKLSGPNRAKVLAMLAGHGVAVASHDDTTVEHVEESHADGVDISEFPTSMVAAEAARAKGMQIVAGSPNIVLGRSHSGNVSVEELARNGLLDALASDYVPSSMLYGAFLLTERLGMPLHDAINMASLAPARMIGLDDRGSIEAGKRADLVRVRVSHGIPIATMVWREGQRVA